MTTPVDALIQAGEFAQALAAIAADPAAARDPALMLVAFNLEVRLQQFDAADRTLRRVVELEPALADAMAGLGRAARAESHATARLTDPQLAGRRAGIGMPPPHALAYVKAAVLHAQRDHAGAAAALAEATAATPKQGGTMTWRNGRTRRFTHLLDSDDLTGPILPCYAGDGVLDIAYAELRAITFGDPRTSFDTMWLPTELVPVRGEPLAVRVPTFHPGTGAHAMPTVRTGQMTLWDRDHGYAIAIGQRDFKLLDDGEGYATVGMLQVRRIELDPPAAPARGNGDHGTDKPKGFFRRLFGN